VKFGLARWVTPGDVNDLRCLGGEGKLEITDLGREAVR
jgi:hypothetical protein